MKNVLFVNPSKQNEMSVSVHTILVRKRKFIRFINSTGYGLENSNAKWKAQSVEDRDAGVTPAPVYWQHTHLLTVDSRAYLRRHAKDSFAKSKWLHFDTHGLWAPFDKLHTRSKTQFKIERHYRYFRRKRFRHKKEQSDTANISTMD